MHTAGPVLLAMAGAALLVLMRTWSTGVPDGGDGVMHYQHARFFWKHAYVALSQWGKPVFSLLASPFTPLGLLGITVFNGLVAICTSLVIMSMNGGAERRAWRWSIPVLLLLTPIYVHTVVAGLTEPLFGLCSVLVVQSIVHRRHGLAMGLASLMPFVRPEYAAFLPFAIAVVLWRRDFRALPWLGAGIVTYSLCSALWLDAPFAFFVDHTYAGRDAYGRGDPMLFVDNIDSMFGVPMKRMLYVVAVLFPILLWRDAPGRRSHLLFASITLLPAAAIFALHAFAWYRGGLGSMGLLRVMATVVPLLVAFIVYVLANAWSLLPWPRWRGWIVLAVTLFYANGAFHELVKRQPLPVLAEEYQLLTRAAADHVLAHREPAGRLIHEAPLIGLWCGVDPWDPSTSLHIGSVLEHEGGNAPRPDDLVVWDAHFAAWEGGVSLEGLRADGRFAEEATFVSANTTTMDGQPYAIHVFRCIEPMEQRSLQNE